MKLSVLGASGATGIPLVEQALAAGHRVTALVRSGKKLTITNPNLRVVEGDATDRAAVSEALDGGDAVISVLGARGPVMAEATRAIVDAAKQKGPERVVMLSSFAVARDRLTPVTKVVTGIAMGSQIKDKTAGEEVLRASSLDWTIVDATKLTNGPKTEARVVPESEKVRMSQKISTRGRGLVPPASGDGRPRQPPRRRHHRMTRPLGNGITSLEPSDGLEPSTPSSMRSDRQLVATGGNGFRLFEPLLGRSGLQPVATGCARLAPQRLHRRRIHTRGPEED